MFSERNDRREIVHNFVIRKFTFNLICRLAYTLIEDRMYKTNDIYCDSHPNREEFIRNAQNIKQYDNNLAKIRYDFKMSLIGIQNTNLGFSKAAAFCWYENQN